jgi:Holliday junction resolvase-like predicted endonuclease
MTKNFKQKGITAETIVHAECRDKGYSILAKNLKIFGVECDLIVKVKNGEIWLIEVKTLAHLDYFERRVTGNQKKRIRQTLSYLMSRYPKSTVRGHLVTVTPQLKTQWYYDFFVI